MSLHDRSGESIPGIKIAVLDTDVDLSHPAFQHARIKRIILDKMKLPDGLSAQHHGTFVSSLIFGNEAGKLSGMAPACTGILIPVYLRDDTGLFCSQSRLAKAIHLALEYGAHIINISGGEKVPNDQSYEDLKQAIHACAVQNVLVVAAAGNDGCACLHFPAALPNVLAVGASGSDQTPLLFSNFGEAYHENGIVVPMGSIVGAVPGGGYISRKSTSYATPLASGLAGLLLSRQLAAGQAPDPGKIREIILQSSIACDKVSTGNCERYLVGTMSPENAFAALDEHLKAAGINPGKASQSEIPRSKASQMPAISPGNAYALPGEIAQLLGSQTQLVPSQKHYSDRVMDQRHYFHLSPEASTKFQFEFDAHAGQMAMPEPLQAEINRLFAAGWPLSMIGATRIGEQVNLRLYLGFREQGGPPSKKDIDLEGYAFGWETGSNRLEIKEYRRLRAQEGQPPAELSQAISELIKCAPAFGRSLQGMAEAIDWYRAQHILQVRDRHSERTSWDLGGLSPPILKNWIPKITQALGPQNNLRDHKTNNSGKTAHNIAFGFDRAGIPFFTIYFKPSIKEHQIQPDNNTIMTEFMENNVPQTESLVSATNPVSPVASVAQAPVLQQAGLQPSSLAQPAPESQARVVPSACACGGNASEPNKGAASSSGNHAGSDPSQGAKIYAIGTLSIEFASEADRLSFEQYSGVDAHNTKKVLAYLKRNPSEGEALHWILSSEGVSTWVIKPHGHFVGEAYEILRELLLDQVSGDVERVAIPGIRYGNSRLRSGQVLPNLAPSTRGMAAWTTDKLMEALTSDEDAKGYERQVREFLNRLYFELRNKGVLPEHRALNYAATNAFQIGSIFQEALSGGMELATFGV
ncbi:MAG TPA: hypothetical protein ENJ82_17750, partial [Bacteroidetes bacterium]|nr:hypothetical protein [Bacteroidota bacterium]